MKAMIFAAGLGTRLKPLTDSRPKALVDVAGKPLLWHTLQKLKNAGFDQIIINVHHLAWQIIDYVEANNRFDIHIEFSDETGQLLDTGGAVKKAARFLDDGEPFLIHNVDILSNIDLSRLYEEHKRSRPEATLVVSRRDTSRYLIFDRANRLRGWVNEKTGESKPGSFAFDNQNYTKLAFAGIQILSPGILPLMNDCPERFSIIDFYLSICNRYRVEAYIPDGATLVDVGKPESLRDAEQFLGAY